MHGSLYVRGHFFSAQMHGHPDTVHFVGGSDMLGQQRLPGLLASNSR